jgi:hypothetical protein
MSEHWRSKSQDEDALSRWFRDRWSYGSLYVVDVDKAVCSKDLSRGLLIEGKHTEAVDKTWRITRYLAEKAGWWSALFEYKTDTGHPHKGKVIEITATFCSPTGVRDEPHPLNFNEFDEWVKAEFGS